ncbi:unnamed protein product [Lactuca virosa]|uniref:Uncharacterized protein n=1 Tax=Lactuca virosa TaxID=75947 RepID=A0AAU9PQS9_9ASTR|nr:unnamed protein product [Lactuca virosa]
MAKTRKEYIFFHNNYFKHDVVVIAYPRSEYGQYRRFDVDTNKGGKGIILYANTWISRSTNYFWKGFRTRR